MTIYDLLDLLSRYEERVEPDGNCVSITLCCDGSGHVNVTRKGREDTREFSFDDIHVAEILLKHFDWNRYLAVVSGHEPI